MFKGKKIVEIIIFARQLDSSFDWISYRRCMKNQKRYVKKISNLKGNSFDQMVAFYLAMAEIEKSSQCLYCALCQEVWGRSGITLFRAIREWLEYKDRKKPAIKNG